MALANVPESVVDPVKLACDAILAGRTGDALPSDTSPSRRPGDVVIDLTGGRAHFCDDDDARRIAEAWRTAEKDPDHIVELDLSLNRISDAGVRELVTAIAARPCRLSSIDLDGNDLTDDSIAFITQHLLTSADKGKTPASAIRRLDLSSNKITDSGVGTLVQGVINSQNTTLQTLILRTNRITNIGMKRLCAWIEESTCPLNSLHVSGNDFTDEILADVGAALTTNLMLTDLNLSNTMKSVNSIEAFSKGVQKHEGLLAVSLQFDGKKREDAGVASTLKRNKEMVRLRTDYVVQLKLKHAEEVASLKQRITELEEKLAVKEKEQPAAQ